MARFTSLEFMEALGLTYFDYNGAKILLRLLQKKGIAKEMGKIAGKGGTGRRVKVYEIPNEFTISVTPPLVMPHHPPKKKKPEPETVPPSSDNERDEVLETVPPSSETQYEYDEGLEED